MKTVSKKKAVEPQKKAINLRIDLELHKRLEAVSDSQKRSLHSQIIWILESSLKNKE
jgi:predicted HicB family RNase H-like nuclease